MKRFLLLLMVTLVSGGFLIAQNSGLDKDKEQAIQNLHGPTVVVPPGGGMGGLGVGDNCSDPIVITLPADLPYSDLSQTNCGRGNDYSNTCLSSYDGGEDIIYRLDVTADITVDISLDSKSTTWTGILIADDCPDVGTCLAHVGNAASTKSMNGVALTAAGSPYYIMVDTWPTPNCIPDFDLNITAAAPPPPGDNCATAIDLSAETSPYDGSTSSMNNDFSFCGMGSSNDFICYYDVEPNATIDIWMSSDTYDSKHSMRYGGSCPGSTEIDCVDDPDDGHITWTNTTGSLERVWYIVAGYSSYSGDFVLEWNYTAPPACPSVTGLDVDNISTTTARLAWNPVSGAVGYDWEVVPAGSPQGTGVVASGNVSDTTVVASGLTASTDYDVYVQNDCGSGYTGPVTFTTACSAATTFPIVEGFEGGVLPGCWSIENVTGSEDWTFEDGGHQGYYGGYPAHAYKGSFNALLYHPSSFSPAVTRLVSPPLDLSGATTPYLTFYHAQASWYGDQDELRVYYKTSLGGTWTLLPGAEWTGDIPDWQSEVFMLPNPSGDYYIAFEATGAYGYGVALDNVQIGYAAPVPLSDWAIYIGIFFILTFLVIGYKRKFA